MFFKQYYLGCLAHASYLIGSGGEAAVVDPQRDVDQYIDEANALGLKIKYIVETHLHADFVSGHGELAARTGAEIVFGRQARATLPHRPVADGDELTVGTTKLQILETPGHTPESICVLVRDSETPDEPQRILTGDTLFIGDVGRPDLAGGQGYTTQAMAAMMYDSLRQKLLTLSDSVEVYPAHGAGSMCGKNLSTEKSSTIGEQRKFNYALQPMSKDEFVKMMTTDLPEAPTYFSMDAEINRTGAPGLDELTPPAALTPLEVKTQASQGDVILDVRAAAEFGAGHVPGALNIGLGGQFAMWAGSLIPISTPLVIVADDEAGVSEAQMRLARVGFARVKGYLSGGMNAWKAADLKSAAVRQITVAELREMIGQHPALQIVDVRRPPEYVNGHVPHAVSAPLHRLRETLSRLPLRAGEPAAIICAGGYRSSTATSILQAAGISDLLNVTGGTSAWINAGYEVEKPEPGSAS